MAAQLMQTQVPYCHDLHELNNNSGAERLGIENIECKAMNVSSPTRGCMKSLM